MAGKNTKSKSKPETETQAPPETAPATTASTTEPNAAEQAQPPAKPDPDAKPVPIKGGEGVTFTSGRLDGYRLVLGNAPHETIRFERGIAVVTDPDLIARARKKPEFGVEFHEV